MAGLCSEFNRVLIRSLVLISISFSIPCGFSCAQTAPAAAASQPPAPKVITLRMLDSRSGHLIATSEYLVQVNHKEEMHADWVKQIESGAGELTLPPEATVINIHAKYGGGMLVYVDCDTQLDKGSAEHAAALDRWYSVADILALGVVAPNGCVNMKVAEKTRTLAKPGEFVFYVRKQNWKETALE